MRFEYEISADEYAECQGAYYRLTTGRKRVEHAVFWIVGGLFFISIAWNERVLNWAPILLAATGLWWTYCGILGFFPERHFRRFYRKSEVAGKKFRADVNDQGFEITGDFCSWRVQWPGVSVKAESGRAFMLCSQGTIFMFGKKYLTDEQQRDLRTHLKMGQ